MNPLVCIVWLSLVGFSSQLSLPSTSNMGVFEGIFYPDGSVDPVGAKVFAGMMLAIEDLNKRTDILPHTKIKFAVRGTDHGDFLKAAKTSQDFVDVVFNGTGVTGVIGTGFYDSSAAMGQVFGYSAINNIDFGANNTDLSHGKLYPYYTRVCPSDAFDGIILASIAKRKYGFTRLSVISTSDTYGSDTSAVFLSEANRRGIYVENTYTMWPGTRDFEDLFKHLRSYGILKVFVIIMGSADAGAVLEAGYKEGIFVEGTQILGTQYVMMPKTWQSMSKTAPVEKIMKGVIGVQPYVNRSTEMFKSFVKRYISQNDTKKILPDGSIRCSNRTDDEGKRYLYLREDSQECGGVTFSKLNHDGSDIDDTVAYAYDAVLGMAVAIDLQLYKLNNYGFTGVDISNTIMTVVNFTGVTGFVTFFVGLGGLEGFLIGDRQTDLTYKILNFNPIFYHKRGKDQSSAIRTIGMWTSDIKTTHFPTYDIFVPCDKEVDDYCTEPIYNTPDGSPVDGSPRIVEIKMSKWARQYLLAGACISFLFVFWYFFVFVLFLDTKLMKTSQPEIMMTVLLGATLASIQIFLKSLETTDGTCKAGMWMGHSAFALIFIALLMKTWRVSRIINSGFRKTKISKDKLFIMTTVAFVLFCIILVVDTYIGNPHQGYSEVFDGHNNIRHIKCVNDNGNVTNALFAIEAFVLFYAAKLCYDSKNAPNAVNDSAQITLSIYLILFVCAVTFPIVFLSIDPTPENLSLVMGTGFIVATVGVVNILFGHRTYLALDGADVDADFAIVRSDQSKSSQEKISNMAARLSRKLRSRTSTNGRTDANGNGVTTMGPQSEAPLDGLSRQKSLAGPSAFSESQSALPSELKRGGSGKQLLATRPVANHASKLASVHEFESHASSHESGKVDGETTDTSEKKTGELIRQRSAVTERPPFVQQRSVSNTLKTNTAWEKKE